MKTPAIYFAKKGNNYNELIYDAFDSKRQIPILANGEITGTYKTLKSLIY